MDTEISPGGCVLLPGPAQEGGPGRGAQQHSSCGTFPALPVPCTKGLASPPGGRGCPPQLLRCVRGLCCASRARASPGQVVRKKLPRIRLPCTSRTSLRAGLGAAPALPPRGYLPAPSPKPSRVWGQSQPSQAPANPSKLQQRVSSARPRAASAVSGHQRRGAAHPLPPAATIVL